MSFDPECCSGRYRLDLSDAYVAPALLRSITLTLLQIPALARALPSRSACLLAQPTVNLSSAYDCPAACGNSENVRATRLGVADTSASGNRQRIVRNVSHNGADVAYSGAWAIPEIGVLQVCNPSVII
jgi:hypothetical protein